MPIGPRIALRLALLAIAMATFAQAPTALASCAPPEPLGRVIATSDVVIVGTVIELANEDRWARVHLEEIWKGMNFAASVTSGDGRTIVEVRGGPEPGTASSVDRAFTLERYLFTLGLEGNTLIDNSCSGTIPWTDDLAALRPVDAQVLTPTVVEPAPGFDFQLLLPIVGVSIVALGFIGGAWLISRARDV